MEKKPEKKCSLKLEAVKIDSIFQVLDGVSWLDNPNISEVSQFSDLDPRTVGKVLKNCLNMGIVQESNKDSYKITIPYPFKGTQLQKTAIMKEVLFKMPLLRNVREFLKLGETRDNAVRKAASVQKITDYEKTAIEPLIKWAEQLGALSLDTMDEDFAEEGVLTKQERHQSTSSSPVIFLSGDFDDQRSMK